MTRFAAPSAALLPIFPDVEPAVLQGALAEGGAPFEVLIVRHGLGPLWHSRTQGKAFAAGRVKAALLYMRQLAALRAVDKLFAQAGVRYAVIKGAATRELMLDDPVLRLCGDIDILITPEQRVEAARVMVESGYRLRLEPSVISHEIMLSKNGVTFDLHWDILRPGRTRLPMTEDLLARRRQHDGWWMLSDDDALFLMLVHNAVSKHVSSRQMALHRAADLVLWWQRRPVDWPTVQTRLADTGLSTAAWTVLMWVRMMSPAPVPPGLETAIDALHPGGIRAAYLKCWLNYDLSARLTNWHLVRLLGFSLMLHDRPSDAWHALKGWWQSRTTSDADALLFKGLSA